MDTVAQQGLSAVEAAGFFGANLNKLPTGKLFRWVHVYLEFPHLLKQVNQELTNARLAVMTEDTTRRIYPAVAALHRSAVRELDRMAGSHPVLAKTVFLPWMLSMERHAERLGDVSEALAWSADPQLRSRLQDSLSKSVKAAGL